MSPTSRHIQKVRTKKRHNMKNTKKCNLNLYRLQVVNIMISGFQMEGYQEQYTPKTDDIITYQNHYTSHEQIYSKQLGTISDNLIADSDRAANWLDMKINLRSPSPSNKIRNRLIKQRNGNGNRTLKMIHWNMTNKHWENKTDEIINTINDFKPELFLISEANYHKGLPEYIMNIPGYYLVHSPTFQEHDYDRLILLVEDDVKVKVRHDLMNSQDVASIWLEVTRRGVRKLTIGCIYREHKLLQQAEGHTTGSERQQNARWRSFLKQWVSACQGGADVIVIGDTNLDHNKWQQPENHLRIMVDMTKQDIETLGFAQLVTWHH